MKFLGLRLDEHDSNVTYSDGVNVRYLKPERYNQIKHFGYDNLTDWVFSQYLLNYKIDELDAICIVLDTHRHPNIKRDKDKLYQTVNIPNAPFDSIKCPVYIIDHHYAHALSSWMLIDKSDIDFVLDGFGDFFKSVSIYKNQNIIKNYTIDEVYSFGLWLGRAGDFLQIGGHPDDVAGKLMALKSYGEVNNTILKELNKYEYEDARSIFNLEQFQKAYGNESVYKYNFINIVTTIHEYIENAMPKFFAKYAKPEEIITYSGGVAHNVCINTKLKKKFSNLIIPPHCGDEGLSLGCVEFLRQLFEQPKFNNDNFPFWQTDYCPKTKPSLQQIKKTAEDLANGKIIGWYQGHGEVGPRALGNRSILMSPEVRNGKDIINQKVKHREEYRPFAASILKEDTQKFFDWDTESKFMKYSVKFKDKIFEPISHIDKTSRIQTVNDNHELFYSLLFEFKKLTGIPMLLNTSLNDNQKPIAGHPNDALNLLKNSELDKLIIGDKEYK